MKPTIISNLEIWEMIPVTTGGGLTGKAPEGHWTITHANDSTPHIVLYAEWQKDHRQKNIHHHGIFADGLGHSIARLEWASPEGRIRQIANARAMVAGMKLLSATVDRLSDIPSFGQPAMDVTGWLYCILHESISAHANNILTSEDPDAVAMMHSEIRSLMDSIKTAIVPLYDLPDLPEPLDSDED